MILDIEKVQKFVYFYFPLFLYFYFIIYMDLTLNKKTQIFKSKQGINFCGYKINEYRLKIRDKGKRKLKKKVVKLKYLVKNGEISSKEAKKYLAGHMGYIKIANTCNLENKLFYKENN